jgi:hypothetical protein
MTRIVEIFVLVNAACGIAAFVIAKGFVKRAKRKITGEDQSTR